MTTNDFAERLPEEHELTKVFTRELVDSIFEMITDAARQGEEVSLFGFGGSRWQSAARKGRNPRTGEAVKIAASKNLKFTAARALKAGLNAKRRGRKTG